MKGVTQMTFVKRLKTLFDIIRAKYGAREAGRWRTLFSKTLNGNIRQLRVTEELPSEGVPALGSSAEAVAEDTAQREMLNGCPPAGHAPHEPPLHSEVDFQELNNLEAFAKGGTVSGEMIEKWVAAGILSPQETRVAEKLIKLMRKNGQTAGSGDTGSPLT
jgi:hypothetical protein